jgi:hypothetical protein
MRQPPRSHRTRAAIVAFALATTLAVAAAPANASLGGVYFDNLDNAAAGDPTHLFNMTFSGGSNVGLGAQVMPSLTTGDGNTALGHTALLADTTGNDNVASGFHAMTLNTSGSSNVATGFHALFNNKTGTGNVAEGNQALTNATGSRNIAIGSNAGINLTTGSRNIDVANPGVAGESGTIRIGSAANQSAAFLAGVWNKTIPGPTKAVVVDSAGRLGTAPKPAAPLRGKDRTFSRLRAENRRQSDQLRQLRFAVQRLREQVRKAG